MMLQTSVGKNIGLPNQSKQCPDNFYNCKKIFFQKILDIPIFVKTFEKHLRKLSWISQQDFAKNQLWFTNTFLQKQKLEDCVALSTMYTTIFVNMELTVTFSSHQFRPFFLSYILEAFQKPIW
jgi:hypothetical protein